MGTLFGQEGFELFLSLGIGLAMGACMHAPFLADALGMPVEAALARWIAIERRDGTVKDPATGEKGGKVLGWSQAKRLVGVFNRASADHGRYSEDGGIPASLLSVWARGRGYA